MLDIIIKNGLVVNHDKSISADICISDGIIYEICEKLIIKANNRGIIWGD